MNYNSIYSSGMIVDFPTSSDRNYQQKKVRFSNNDQLYHYYVATLQETQDKWYSEEDYYRFALAMIREAIIYSRKLRKHLNSPNQDITYDGFVGLEALISNDVCGRYKLRKAMRKRHYSLVIDEHHRQLRNKSNDPDALARASRASSQVARERSQKIGVLVESIEINCMIP
jgi:hypothetical protein